MMKTIKLYVKYKTGMHIEVKARNYKQAVEKFYAGEWELIPPVNLEEFDYKSVINIKKGK